MRKFHPATIIEKRAKTADSVVLTLAVPDDVADEFRYLQGQHLPVRAEIDGKSVRRTYSICSSVADGLLRLGVRVQQGGQFSNYIADTLDVGSTLEVMPPYGHFNTPLSPEQAKNYVAFVAGSGITPVLSLLKTALQTEAESRFLLFYGNRKRSTTMFIEELYALKNLYRERLALHFIMSREPTEIGLYEGRLDADKALSLHRAFVGDLAADEIFLCGPNPMIDELTTALTGLGYQPARIHSERFRPGQKGEQLPRSGRSVVPDSGTQVTVVMDGHRQSFFMGLDDRSILDAGLDSGIDLPYSCKGGVCSTCRCKLTAGEVDMALNYALESWETEQGFILACQSRPKTSKLELDYDQT